MRIFLAAAMLMAAGTANATIVEFSNVRATWFDVQGTGLGPGRLTFTGNGTANASVRWGLSGVVSGYDFSAANMPQLVVNPPSGSATTSIGTFRHVNQPISTAVQVTGLKLRFTTDVLVDSNYYTTVNFIYNFGHWETPNADDPCANGGEQGVGLNINGCADRVRTNFNSQSDGFDLTDGQDIYHYALDVVGFRVANQNLSEFWTVEQQTNEAEILGAIRLYTSAVPEPASWAMLIAGFGMVGVASRRRKALAA